MFLWWKKYSNCDLELAESTWQWTSNGKSTWDNSLVFGKAQKRDKIFKELLNDDQ
jgi:hypothetical protein